MLWDKSGTTCYLAPELIGMNFYNKLYDEKVDVYSLGIILYEILTEKNPFDSSDYQESLHLNFKNKIDYSKLWDG